MRALLAAVLLLVWGAPARAQPELMEYRVRPGDTCASIARRFYGDARAYDRIHVHNPGMGPPPHRLEPGTVLRIPRANASGSEGPDARLTAARRRVEARAPRDARWQPARVGQPLEGGWQVATHERSYAQLTFRDDSQLDMREHTLVVIYGGSRRLARRTEAHATLERGALRSRLSELAGRVEVETPSSRAEVGSGTAVLTVDPQGTSRLANLGGEAATVTAGRASVRVPPGTGTVVTRGGRPSPPRPLPQAPRWANDLAGRFVGLTGRGGTLRGSWQPVEDASRYRVEVAARPDGSDVVAAVEVPATRHEFEVHRLPPGVYYVSVATIDRALFEGPPSPRRAMQVLSARIIPPGGAEPVEEPYDPGDPSRPPAPPRVLPGTWVVAPPSMRCAAGDGEPREMITLREPGRATVRCVDVREREVPAFDVDVARVEAHLDPPDAHLVRGRPTELRVRLESDPPPPTRLLAAAPDGARVERPRRMPDGTHRLRVTPHHDAPDVVTIALDTTAATERITLATIELPVTDPEPATEPGPPAPSPPPPASPPSPHVLETLPRPRRVPLRMPVERGSVAWIAGGFSPERFPFLGGAVGARARVFDEPLRLGFAWMIGPGLDDHPDAPGSGDLLADASWSFVDADHVDASIDFTAWIPTGATDASLDAALLIPGFSVTWRALDALRLRTRQALLLDLSSLPNAWTWAVGADYTFANRLALGAELGGSLRKHADTAVGHMAASAAVRLGPVVPTLTVSANPATLQLTLRTATDN